MQTGAGIQRHPVEPINRFWIPAYAGMTRGELENAPTPEIIVKFFRYLPI